MKIHTEWKYNFYTQCYFYICTVYNISIIMHVNIDSVDLSGFIITFPCSNYHVLAAVGHSWKMKEVVGEEGTPG